MGIMLGNLSLDMMEKEQGFVLSNEDRETLASMRQDNADVKKGSETYHIFDIPLTIFCGRMDVAQKGYDILKKYEIHGQIGISVS